MRFSANNLPRSGVPKKSPLGLFCQGRFYIRKNIYKTDIISTRQFGQIGVKKWRRIKGLKRRFEVRHTLGQNRQIVG